MIILFYQIFYTNTIYTFENHKYIFINYYKLFSRHKIRNQLLFYLFISRKITFQRFLYNS